MNKELLIIDCQVLQTSSFYRGMGRYSLFLIKSLLKSNIIKKYSKIVLLINKNLPYDNFEESFNNLLSKNIVVKKISFPHKCASKKTILETKKVLDNFIKKYYLTYQISFFILSAFETGETLSVFPTNVFKILLFYDLIPLIFEDKYLIDKTIIVEYFSRFKQIFEADLILSISATTKNDLVSYLNVDKSKIVNIAGGSISKTKFSRKTKISIKKPYFLFPSGDNWRKNNKNTIDAFKIFNKNNNYSLIITSDFNEITQKQLKGHDANIIFSGRVSDSEMLWLYKNSQGIVFPSVYEGLGLPILEAIEQNKPILLSNIEAFKEFGNKGFLWCEPNSVKSIVKGFTKLSNFKIKTKEYKKILNKFNWQTTAQKVVQAIEIYKFDKKNKSINKKKIALVGPSPNGYSAVGKFCLELLPVLNEVATVDFYYETPPNFKAFKKTYFNYVWNSFSIIDLPKNYKKYDQIIYNIGNSEFHVQTYMAALMFPDTLILHDINLTGLFSVIEKKFPKWNKRSKIEEQIERHFYKQGKTRFVFSLINKQNRIFCHNNYSSPKIEKLLLNNEVECIKTYHPFVNLEIKKKNINNKKTTIAISGLISYAKGLDSIIQLIKKNYKEYNFIIFGYTFYDQAFLDLTKLSKKGMLKLCTNVSDYEFNQLLKKSDFLINLRPDYKGEASRTVLDAFKNGTIPIVSNVGWFAELPDELSIKINNENELGLLLEDFEKLNNIKKEYDFDILNDYLESINYKNYVKKLLH